MDELGALTRVAEIRAILANAGRWDLADWVWGELCPPVPMLLRMQACRQAGYRADLHPRNQQAPAPRTPISLAQQRAHRRAVVLGEARAQAAAKGITADSPTLLDSDTDLAYALERADYTEG